MRGASGLNGGSTLAGILGASDPAGVILGALLVTRVLTLHQQVRAVPVLAMLTVGSLLLCGLGPPTIGVVVLYAVSGFGTVVLVIAKSRFVTVVPPAYRARAGGVAASGLVLAQAIGLFASGALADLLSVPVTMVIFGTAGLVLSPVILLAWPPFLSITPTSTATDTQETQGADPGTPNLSLDAPSRL